MKLNKLFLLVSAMIVAVSANSQFAEYKYQDTKHFIGVKNTGSNMTLGIPETSWDVAPETGDEIAAFNSIGQLVGSSVFLGGNFAVTIWGDDETTLEKEGVAEEMPFTLRLWRAENGTEETIIVERWLEGNDIYATNAICVTAKVKVNNLQNIQTEYQLQQNTPNPAGISTQITYYLPNDARATLAIYSTDGKLVKEVANSQHLAGVHTVDVTVSDLPAGNYYYKLSTEEFSAVKSMSVIR